MAQVTVIGRYLAQDGISPGAGQVEFVRSDTIRDPSAQIISPPVRTVAKLDGSGAFEVTLLANDGAIPAGTTYTVHERLRGATQISSWSLTLDGSSPVDVSSFARSS